MIIGMIPAVNAYLADRWGKRVRLAVAMGACAGAAVAVVGVIWFIPHILGLDQSGTLGIGFYLVILAAVLGLVFAISLSLSYWQNSLKRINTLYKRLKGDYNNAP
jgi:MFS family permease